MATQAGPGPAPSARPTGTVTFLFSDIEGSTLRWDRDRAAMQDAVRRHDALMRAAIAEHDGYVFKTIGDAFCAAFARPEDAVAAILDAQRALAAEDFSGIDGLRVRAAVHTGTADEREGDYFGPTLNRVARLLAIGSRRAGRRLRRDGADSAGRACRRSAAARSRQAPAQGSHRTRTRLAVRGAGSTRNVSRRCARSKSLPNNLPRQLTPLVGREDVLAEVERAGRAISAGDAGRRRRRRQDARGDASRCRSARRVGRWRLVCRAGAVQRSRVGRQYDCIDLRPARTGRAPNARACSWTICGRAGCC